MKLVVTEACVLPPSNMLQTAAVRSVVKGGKVSENSLLSSTLYLCPFCYNVCIRRILYARYMVLVPCLAGSSLYLQIILFVSEKPKQTRGPWLCFFKFGDVMVNVFKRLED